MARLFCQLHNKKHEAYAWKHKHWIDGQEDGWACDAFFTPEVHEFTTETIKQEREKYGPDQVQPWRQGELSREYLEQYPDKAAGMLKEGIITKEQIRKSKRVWKDVKGTERIKDRGIAERLGSSVVK